MRTLIILLFISGQVFGQYCPKQKWEPAPVENYIAGAMLIGTFVTVELADKSLYAKYAPTQNWKAYKNQRFAVALTCMATSTATYFIIKKIRTKKHHRWNYNRH